jgi:hypothetical protein
MSVGSEQVPCDAFPGVTGDEAADLPVQLSGSSGGERHREIEIIHVRSGDRQGHEKSPLNLPFQLSARIIALSQRTHRNATESAKRYPPNPLTERG